MFEEWIEKQLKELKAEGRHRELFSQTPLSFVHNDYLGLARHPRLVAAGEKALSEWGAGSRGSRLLGGNSDLFEKTESEIAAFFKAPASLLFSTGYLANLGLIQSLAPMIEHVYSDETNHASLIDAIRLTHKPKTIVRHNQWRGLLGTQLTSPALLVAESLYSMDGDFVDATELNSVLKSAKSFLVLDESHAMGIAGEGGRGLNGFFPDWSRKAVVVTFGKAFGVSGAAVLCSPNLKQWLINAARSFIYTTAPSPVVVAMIAEALKIVSDEPWRGEELRRRSVFLRDRFRQLRPPALKAESSPEERFSPIIPLYMAGENNALRFCENMRKSGIELRAIRSPTVPRGGERIRVSVNLSTSREQIELLAETVEKAWTAFS